MMQWVVAPFPPTGQNLSLENMEEIVRFCHKEGLLLFSDEVLTPPLFIILLCCLFLVNVVYYVQRVS